MLGLPPSVMIIKDLETALESQGSGPLCPPIITHTAATPMATPQGSPNSPNVKTSLGMARSFGSNLQIDVGVSGESATPVGRPLRRILTFSKPVLMFIISDDDQSLVFINYNFQM